MIASLPRQQLQKALAVTAAELTRPASRRPFPAAADVWFVTIRDQKPAVSPLPHGARSRRHAP